jgi:uncharacterized protein (TIGR00369 family)
MPATPWLVDRDGVGQLLTLIEEALSLAALTGAQRAMEVSTATLSTNYLRPATIESEMFVARARIGNSGRAYTLAEVGVEDSGGRRVARSTACLLIRPMDRPPPPLASPLEPVPEPMYPTLDPYCRPELGTWAPWVTDEGGWLSSYQKVSRGDISGWPAVKLLGVRLAEAEEGRVAAILRTSEWLCGRRRVVTPGVIAYFAQIALGGAVLTAIPEAHRFGILSVNMTFLRPVVPDGRDVVAQGTVVHQAGDVLVSTVEVIDADGNLVALGQETGMRREPRPAGPTGGRQERALLTVVFTDLVESTKRAETLGDRDWRELLGKHDALVRGQLDLFKGREVKSLGDGFLATFDAPARAIHFARGARAGATNLGLEIRAGIHTGECEMVGSDVAGIAIHLAARLLATAAPSEILVSSTVHDLVAGSGIQFRDRGLHELKGIEGERQLFAVRN